MDTEQVKEFLKRIDINYQTNWSDNKDIILEWYKDLKNYDLEDVNKSLNYYMKSNYASIPPKRWAILNQIKTTEQKERQNNLITKCQLCGKSMNMNLYDNHYSKCLDIEFLVKSAKKWLDKDITKEELESLSKIDIEDKVLKMQKYIYKNTDNQFEKQHLEIYLRKVGLL